MTTPAPECSAGIVPEMGDSGECSGEVREEITRGVHDSDTQHPSSFVLALQPIMQYVAREKLTDQAPPPVTEQLEGIERAHRITSNFQAMAALLAHGFESAYKIVGTFTEPQFVEEYKDHLGGEQQARLVYAEARKVHESTLNVAAYLAAQGTRGRIDPGDPILGGCQCEKKQ